MPPNSSDFMVHILWFYDPNFNFKMTIMAFNVVNLLCFGVFKKLNACNYYYYALVWEGKNNRIINLIFFIRNKRKILNETKVGATQVMNLVGTVLTISKNLELSQIFNRFSLFIVVVWHNLLGVAWTTFPWFALHGVC